MTSWIASDFYRPRGCIYNSYIASCQLQYRYFYPDLYVVTFRRLSILLTDQNFIARWHAKREFTLKLSQLLPSTERKGTI